MNEPVLNKLERRLGRLHARQRLGIETDHEAQIFGQGINFFHIENWYSIHGVIRTMLKLMGLYWRGRKNAQQIQIRHNQCDPTTERAMKAGDVMTRNVDELYGAEISLSKA